VKHGTVIARLMALPMAQRVIAVLVSIAAACGFYALILSKTNEFASSAVLSYNAPTGTDLAAQGLPVVTQATEILDEQVQVGAVEPPGMTANPLHGQGIKSWRNNLVISEISPTQIRVMWRAHDAQRTEAMVQALANLLASWHPQENEERRLLEQNSSQQDPERNREEALLRVTVAMLDAKAAELNAELGQMSAVAPQIHSEERGSNIEAQVKANLANVSVDNRTALKQQGRRSILEKEIERIHRQRAVVMGRLVESRRGEFQKRVSKVSANEPVTGGAHGAPGAGEQLRRSTELQSGGKTASSPGETQPSSTQASPFVVLERASAPQPLTGSRSAFMALGALAGIACGVLYLALALWWLHPIADVEALERILGRDIRLVGTIAEIR
jgi:hypothetical protein